RLDAEAALPRLREFVLDDVEVAVVDVDPAALDGQPGTAVEDAAAPPADLGDLARPAAGAPAVRVEGAPVVDRQVPVAAAPVGATRAPAPAGPAAWPASSTAARSLAGQAWWSRHALPRRLPMSRLPWIRVPGTPLRRCRSRRTTASSGAWPRKGSLPQ